MLNATSPARPKKTPHPVNSLPFVALKAKSARWWSLPATGGFAGGYKAGEAMAEAYIKWLHETDTEHLAGNNLSFILESFFERMNLEGANEYANQPLSQWPEGLTSIRGQYAGFFGTFNTHLIRFAKVLGHSIAAIPQTELIKRASAGTSHDDSHWMAQAEAIVRTPAPSRKKRAPAPARH